MKAHLLAAAFIMLLLSTGKTQELSSVKRNNFFGIGPFDLFANTLQFCYERQFSNRNSVALMGGFKLSKKNEAIDRIGANGEVQYRVNILYDKEGRTTGAKNYATLPYFAPYVQYRYEEIYAISAPTTFVNSCFTGVGFGIRFTGLQNRFTLNIFGGGGLKLADSRGAHGYDSFLQVGYTGIAPKVACYMGIAF